MALVPFPSNSPAHRDPDEDEPLDSDEELDGAGGKMSFLEHLDELRKRLIVSVYALIGGCVISFIFVQRLQAFIYEPLYRLMPGGQPLIYTAPMEGFMNMMKVGALGGLFLALPVVVFQLWLFIAPGLYSNEKRFAIPFVFLSTVFFTLGAAFSHYVAFPWTMQFFASFERPDMMFLPAIKPVFAMYVKMMLAMGLVFEMPTAVYFLARVGLVTAGFLLRQFKYAVLVIFVAAAILTPGTDVVSQALMAGPMIVLYIISIGIAWMFAKKKAPVDPDA
jgi:sec-independent protein translocase protein TatC